MQTPSDHHDCSRAHDRRGVRGRIWIVICRSRRGTRSPMRQRRDRLQQVRPERDPEPVCDKPVRRRGRPDHDRRRHHPDISRVGRLFAYDSIDAGQSTTDVFLSSSQGARPRNITNSPATNDIQPDLSPDGKSIAYSSGTAGERNARIVVKISAPGSTRDYAVCPRTGSVRPELVALGSLDHLRHVQRSLPG